MKLVSRSVMPKLGDLVKVGDKECDKYNKAGFICTADSENHYIMFVDGTLSSLGLTIEELTKMYKLKLLCRNNDITIVMEAEKGGKL